MTDETFEIKEALYTAIHNLVDAYTKNLSPDEDYDLRQCLTEDFRFWRRAVIAADREKNKCQ